MTKFYIINGLGPGFDGVLIEGEPVVTDSSSNEPSMVSVLRFVENDIVVGDRPLITPVTPDEMFLSFNVLEEVGDPKIREFDSTNPYGKYQVEGRMKCGSIEVAYSQFKQALQVNVQEVAPNMNKTLLAVNFTKPEHFQAVKELIETSLKNQDDADQLVFKLEEARDKYNG